MGDVPSTCHLDFASPPNLAMWDGRVAMVATAQ
jgi:hypothetical protein